MITSSLNSALQGMQNGNTLFVNSARKIAFNGFAESSGSAAESSLPRDLVGLKSGQFLYEANMQVARSADEMLGTLIDTLA